MADPNNVKSIFVAASEKPRAERAAFLDEATSGDGALRARIEALLQAHDNPDSFLANPAAEFGATVDLSPAEPPLTERPGTLIGPYRLLEQIGEGGMGVVYMADQQAPVRRRVALKIIKAGMDTRQVIARFEAERQALALMDHSNIARVLDAGATVSGRPYFVMELVRGVPITEYCDRNNLPVHRRLELFVQVCHAVQHAHQKGIIHRDLKPSNVLVTLNDGRAVPKVIDFGVAKATNQQLTEKTLFTAFAQLVGTPLYMSPEQAEMTSLDIDTRSDVYSLGVLLYELLTGTTPFDPKELRSKALAEMQRIIREVEPPTPSTRLSTLTDTLPSVAAQRAVEPRRLAAMVRGELDWIVMRCLEKDRKRRYQTASSLADDLERYLTDQPIEARPATRIYRLKKFARRNKVAVLAGSAIAVTLLLGLAMATVGFVQAHRQAQIAVAQAAKTTAISNLLQQMLQSASPEAAKGTEYTVRQMLDDFSAGLGDQLHDQPEVEAAIRATIGNAYLQLNKPDQAEPHLRGALQIRQRLYGENHPDVASSYFAYASRVGYYGKFAEGEELLRKSLAIYEKLGIENDATIESLNLLGWLMYHQMRYREAEAAYEKAREMVRKQPNPDQQPLLATILRWQAQVTLGIGNTTKAEQMARESVALHRKLRGSQHWETSRALCTLALILGEQQKFDEAAQNYREAIAIQRDQNVAADHSIQFMLTGLAYVLHVKGDQAALSALDAEQSANATSILADCDKAVALYPNSWVLLGQRGRAYALQGDFERAAADLARATELAPEIAVLNSEHAMVCFARNDDAGFRQASKALADAAMRGSDRYAGQLAAQAFILVPDSEINSGQALEFAQRTLEADSKNGVALGLLGATLYRLGRYEEAAQRLTEALAAYGEYLAKTGLEAYVDLFLSMTHHRLGHSKEARDWLNRAVQIIEAGQGVAADRLNSIVLERLRQEAKSLIGVVVKREAIETTEQQAPTIEPQPSTDVNPPSDKPVNPDAATPEPKRQQ